MVTPELTPQKTERSRHTGASFFAHLNGNTAETQLWGRTHRHASFGGNTGENTGKPMFRLLVNCPLPIKRWKSDNSFCSCIEPRFPKSCTQSDVERYTLLSEHFQLSTRRLNATENQTLESTQRHPPFGDNTGRTPEKPWLRMGFLTPVLANIGPWRRHRKSIIPTSLAFSGDLVF